MPYFAVSVEKFSNALLENNMDSNLREMKKWIEGFLSSYDPKFLTYQLDSEKLKYMDKFLELEKRILHIKLDKKLPMKKYEQKKIKI